VSQNGRPLVLDRSPGGPQFSDHLTDSNVPGARRRFAKVLLMAARDLTRALRVRQMALTPELRLERAGRSRIWDRAPAPST
jgi:hypothetical protein